MPRITKSRPVGLAPRFTTASDSGSDTGSERKEERVHEAIDRCVGSDAERQRENRQHAESLVRLRWCDSHLRQSRATCSG